jgi:2-dehydropantoate 2-reductase
MRVGVIGAGAVGGVIAALLARAGNEVEIAARGENLEAIRKGGIRLGGAWGDYTAEVTANEVLTRAPELVIIATKAQDSAAAIRANYVLLRGVPVAIVQNGLDSVSASAPLLPRSDVVGVLALFAASLLAPGHLAVTTPGHSYVGGGTGENDLPARYVARVLGEVMPVTVTPNFVGAQWTKLVVNQINALPAITGLSAQEVIAIPALRRIMTRSIRENVRVGMRLGIRFAELQGLTERRLRLLARSPLAIGQLLPLLLRKRMGATPNPGSTLQSIRRGAPTEIDYLNGAVVVAAERAGTTAPVNAALVELVHEVERTGEFLEPAEVVARVGG